MARPLRCARYTRNFLPYLGRKRGAKKKNIVSRKVPSISGHRSCRNLPSRLPPLEGKWLVAAGSSVSHRRLAATDVFASGCLGVPCRVGPWGDEAQDFRRACNTHTSTYQTGCVSAEPYSVRSMRSSTLLGSSLLCLPCLPCRPRASPRSLLRLLLLCGGVEPNPGPPKKGPADQALLGLLTQFLERQLQRPKSATRRSNTPAGATRQRTDSAPRSEARAGRRRGDRASTPACRDFAAGRCLRGSACRYRHETNRKMQGQSQRSPSGSSSGPAKIQLTRAPSGTRQGVTFAAAAATPAPPAAKTTEEKTAARTELIVELQALPFKRLISLEIQVANLSREVDQVVAEEYGRYLHFLRNTARRRDQANSKPVFACSQCHFLATSAPKLLAHQEAVHKLTSTSARLLRPKPLQVLPNLGTNCVLSAVVGALGALGLTSSNAAINAAITAPNTHSLVALSNALDIGLDTRRDLSTILFGLLGDSGLASSTSWTVKSALSCPTCGLQIPQPDEPIKVLGLSGNGLVDLNTIDKALTVTTTVQSRGCSGSGTTHHAPQAFKHVKRIIPNSTLVVGITSPNGIAALPEYLTIAQHNYQPVAVICVSNQHATLYRWWENSWWEVTHPSCPKASPVLTTVRAIFLSRPRTDSDNDDTTPKDDADSAPLPPQPVAASAVLGLFSLGGLAGDGPLLPTGRRIVSWNCHSLNARGHLADTLLADPDTCILGLQELGPPSALAPWSQDYNVSVATGMAMLSRKNTFTQEVLQLPPMPRGIDAMGVRLQSSAGWLCVVNVYAHPSFATSDTFHEALTLLEGTNPDILLGDLNAGSPGWSQKTTQFGPSLCRFLASSSLRLVAPPRRTHTGGSTIDLFLVRGSFPHSQAFVARSPLGSDHFPVALSAPACLPAPSHTPRVLWKKVTDVHLSGFSKALGRLRPKRGGSVDTMADSLSHCIEHSLRLLPRGIPGRKLILSQATRDLLDTASHAWALGDATAGVTADTAAGLAAEEAATKHITNNPWTYWRSLDQVPIQGPIQDSAGKIARQPRQQAEMFRRAWAAKHAPSPDADPAPPLDLPLTEKTPPVTLAEVRAAIQAQPPTSGVDNLGLSPRLLSALPGSFLCILCALITRCFNEGRWPATWKISVGRPIAKTGRDPTLIDSYRPVQVCQLLARIAERVLLTRLEAACTGTFDPSQMGFTRGVPPTLPIAALVERANLGFQQEYRPKVRHSSPGSPRVAKRHKTIAVCVDFSDAFCRIRGPRVAHLLRTAHNVHANYCMTMQAIFTDRRLQVLLRGHLTQRLTLPIGGHQGGVITPFAWKVLMNPLPARLRSVQLPSVGRAAGFANLLADDTTLGSTSASPEQARASCNAQLATIATWCREEGVELNAKKTVALVLSGTYGSASNDWLQPLTLGGRSLPVGRSNDFASALRVNGLYLDTALSMAVHIHWLIQGLYTLLDRLKLMAYRFPRRTLRELYVGSALSRILYAAPIWWPHATPGARRDLETMHRAFGRVISGCIGTSPSGAVLAEAGLKPLGTTIARLGCRLAAQLVRLAPSVPAAAICCPPNFVPQGAAPDLHTDNGSFAQFWLSAKPAADREALTLASPLQPHLFPQRSRASFLPHSRSPVSVSSTEAERFEENARRIAALGRYDYIVATDGSVSPDLQLGLGGAIVFDKQGQRISSQVGSAGPLACSFSAEVLGLELGLSLLQPIVSGSAEPLLIAHLSDSQSGIAALATGPRRQRYAPLERVWSRISSWTTGLSRHCFRSIFVFSHVGSPFNTEVDTLLHEATELIRQGNPPPPDAPAWWIDEARPRWQGFALTEELKEKAAAPFRDSLWQALPQGSVIPPWTCEGDKLRLPRSDERLLAQLRSGVTAYLPGWRHEQPEPCPLCGAAAAFRRGDGAQVHHLFTCSATAQLRPASGISSLLCAPTEALSFARAVLALMSAAH